LFGPDGIKPKRVTSTPGGIEDFKWSRDGKMIAFTDHGPPTEAPGQMVGDDAIEVDKDPPPPRLWVLTLSNRKAVQVPSLGFAIQNFTWSPDGSEFAVIRELSPSLVIVSRSTGKVIRTLSENVGLTNVLRWSPDGSFIAFYDAVPGDFSAWWLAVIPATGGRAKPILKDHSLTILDAQWMPDSKHLIAEIVEGTQGSLVAIDIKSESIRRLAALVVSQASFSFSTNGGVTAYLNESPRSPNDVWILQSDGSTHQLTHLNTQVATWALGDVKEVRWKNTKDGLSLRGVLITPPSYRAGHAYPTIVQTHIGDCPWWPGWLANWWIWGQLLASHGYIVFLPNTRGVTGQGWQLHRTINDWGGMAFQDLMDGIDSLVAQGIANPNRLGIGGWSNGGFMTEYAITHTTRFKAAVAEAGHSDFFSLFGTSPMRTGLLVSFRDNPYVNRQPYDKSSPITHVRECKTPTLVLHGINDDGVPVGQGYEFHYALKSMGVATDMAVYPREGHSIDEPLHQLDLQNRVLAWFDRYLKK
jgi:dipeptidyl aminopeptidase/acylaminoacyl peptidase